MTSKVFSSIGLWIKRLVDFLRKFFEWPVKPVVGFLHKPFEWLVKFVSVVANLAVIFGIYFAYTQLQLSSTLEKRRTAIEAVSQVRTPEFQRDVAQLKKANKDKTPLDNPTIDALNYVMNVYDHIAILYIYDLADRCIIKESTYPAIKEMSDINDAIPYPSDARDSQAYYRKRFTEALELMKKESCERPVPH